MDNKLLNKMLAYLIVLFLNIFDDFQWFSVFFITLAFSAWSLKHGVYTLNVADVVDIVDVVYSKSADLIWVF
jgi:hypothetical protein